MWYELTLDELTYNENQKLSLVTEPAIQARTLIEMLINEVLEQLGIVTDISPEATIQQQEDLGVDIREMDEEQLRALCVMTKKTFNPAALGFYIYQDGDPMAFVSDAYVQGGRVKVACEPYNSKIKFNEKSFALKKMRGDA